MVYRITCYAVLSNHQLPKKTTVPKKIQLQGIKIQFANGALSSKAQKKCKKNAYLSDAHKQNSPAP